MEIERPHRTTSAPTTASELFICFTSRLSYSTSMRLSSKSIHSPGRAGEKSAASFSLPTSLSRRLRHNGSLKSGGAGHQSPAMFSKKNKGSSGFDNPEPSSPKVTCIGQVRVKTKKQGRKMKVKACKSKSKRLSGGDASFRRIENTHEGLIRQNSQRIQNQSQDCNLPHWNQRWVHLPSTICEALRAFGAEFSCLLPCKPSCFSGCSNQRDKGEKGLSNSSDSCGAVCRWLVAVQEGEGEGERKGRGIEMAVTEEDGEGKKRMMIERGCSRRRSIFDDMDFKDEIFDVDDEVKGEEDEAARVSTCIPPKNALLLMRCRSVPTKMSALSQKIWEAPVAKDYNDEEEEAKEGEAEEENSNKVCVSELEEGTEESIEETENLGEECEESVEMCEYLAVIEKCVADHEIGFEDLVIRGEKEEQEPEDTEELETEEKQSSVNVEETEQHESVGAEEVTQLIEDENEPRFCPIEAVSLLGNVENVGNEQDLVMDREEEDQIERAEESDLSSSVEESTKSQENQEQESQEEEKYPVEKHLMVKSTKEEESPLEECQQPMTHQRSEPNSAEKPKEESKNEPECEKEHDINEPILPDCLLLMMREPKLSMEVSNETWVCSNDFIRWLPDRHPSKIPNQTGGSDEPEKKKDAQAPQLSVQTAVQPARSSISFPANHGPVTANLMEQKRLKGGVGYEPLVLTRCKSAPLRSTAQIVPPELACSLWRRENGRGMEPYRASVGAAGVGF